MDSRHSAVISEAVLNALRSHLRPWKKALAVSGWLVGCRQPTEVVVEITTDIKCADHPSTGIAVGDLATLETRPFSSQTDHCTDSTGRIGSIVVLPGSSNDGSFALRVVAGITKSADDCVASGYGAGCVVVRRSLGFVPHDTLYLPIIVEASCIGIPCEATQTCRNGQCVSATIPNPDDCKEKPGCDISAPSGFGGSGSPGGTSSSSATSRTSANGGSPSGGSPSGGTRSTTDTPSGGASGGSNSELPIGGTNAGGNSATTTLSLSGASSLGGAASTTTFSIKLTEVTRSEYEAWLNTGPDILSQPSYCNWNTSFAPTCSWPPGTQGNYPVTCVDWCDAYAYCAGTNQRLCGKIGGGALAFADFADATQSQWYSACSTFGLYSYPYSNTYNKNSCNGTEAGLGAPSPVASFAGCHSTDATFSNVYDMTGNVSEWEDSCNGNVGQYDFCRVRGGSFAASEANMTCTTSSFSSRGYSGSDYGIRCCSKP